MGTCGPKLFGQPLTLATNELFTSRAELFGETHQTLSTNRSKGRGVHVVLQLPHALNKVGKGFMKLVVTSSKTTSYMECKAHGMHAVRVIG